MYTNKTAQPSKNTHQPQTCKQVCTVRIEMDKEIQNHSQDIHTYIYMFITLQKYYMFTWTTTALRQKANGNERNVREQRITENEMTNFLRCYVNFNGYFSTIVCMFVLSSLSLAPMSDSKFYTYYIFWNWSIQKSQATYLKMD